MYVSKRQWDFVNRGARACFFGLTENEYNCRRPITGQYVTLTLEYEQDSYLDALMDLKVFGHRKYLNMKSFNNFDSLRM